MRKDTLSEVRAGRRLRMGLAVILLAGLAACGAGPATPSATPTDRPTLAPSATPTITPTFTPTPTKTDLPTAVPMVTPSPGPAPDLEITNVTFSGRLGDVFMAEVHNNSEETIFLPSFVRAFQFTFDRWIMYKDTPYGDLFDHFVYSPLSAFPGEDSKSTNCFLYPDEKSVISLPVKGLCPSTRCNLEEEELNRPPKELGFQLREYEDLHRSYEEWKKLEKHLPETIDPNYHPEIKNITYQINLPEIQFEFDVYISPDFDVFLASYDFPTWVVLYDENGRIINILFNKFDMDLFLKYGDNHVVANSGIYRRPNATRIWFYPEAELTRPDLERLDHIWIFMEIQPTDICYYAIDPKKLELE